MEFETILRSILGLLGATPLMLLINEILRLKGFLGKIVLWFICFWISGYCLGEWMAVLAVLFLIINIFIIIGYLSIYYPKAIKYFKNKVFDKNN